MPPEYVSRVTIKFNGVPLKPELIPFLEEICVDDKAQVPSMFSLKFVDYDHDVLGKTTVQIGSSIEIQTTELDKTQPYTLLKGEVTALEGEYDVTGARAIIRGYDLSYRLHRGRHTETYVDTTDSDIASKIARRHGIETGTIKKTTETYKHVSQANMSDWDFLTELALKNGYEVSVTAGKMNFAPPPEASGAPAPGNLRSTGPAQLVYGSEIIEFHPRITAGAQVDTVKVRGWDPDRKQEIVGTAQAKTVSAALDGYTPLKVAGALGSAHGFVSVNRAVASVSDANNIAGAIAEQIGSAFAEADGVAIGDPRIVAGKAISIGNVSPEFKGKWVVSQARHLINDEGYRIYFSVTGRQERSMLGLTSHGFPNGSSARGPARYYGMVVGIVTDDNDPDKRHRVKVRFPWLADKSGSETYESSWARVVQFGAGDKRGAYFMPEINDEVLVAFEHGNIDRPYVIGGLYNGQDKPYLGIASNSGADDAVDGSGVKRRGYTSRKGHAIVFVDDDSADDGIVLRTSDGKLKIQLKAQGKELHISGDTKVIVTAEQELTLESKKDINIKAQGNLKLEASTGVDMKSNATFKIQGTTVDLKGSGPVSVSGTPIKLN